MMKRILQISFLILVAVACVNKEHNSASSSEKEIILAKLDSVRNGGTYESMLMEKGKVDAVIALCLELANNYPDAPEAPNALFEVTRLAWNSDNKSLAVKIHDRIINEYPDHEQIELSYYMKATILDELRQKDKAVTAYKEFINKFPDSHNVKNAEFRIENIDLSIIEAAMKNIEE